MTRYWMLPEDVIEQLPDTAIVIETLRRKLLDTMSGWGYRQVMPPLVEFLDSLLAGSGDDLDVQTFKLTDQTSGRMMGVRADITPQIARIDAHRMLTDKVSRYSYCGEVLRTRSESTWPRRNPTVLGAELFGVSALSGDMEIMAMLLDVMGQIGVSNSVLDIGHSGIFAGMVDCHQLDRRQQEELREVILGVRRPDLKIWKDNQHFSEECINDIRFLVDALLESDNIAALKNHFGGRHPEFDRAIAELEIVTRQLAVYYPNQRISVDMTNVGTYGYHSGLLFALYAPGHYDAIVRGGRYDGLGEVYGRARAATGFSIDLLTLGQLLECLPQVAEAEDVALPRDINEFNRVCARRAAGETLCFEHREET